MAVGVIMAGGMWGSLAALPVEDRGPTKPTPPGAAVIITVVDIK